MLITNPDGHGRRCPICDERIHDDGDCLRCSKNTERKASLSDPPAEHWIRGTLQTFILSDEEIAEVKARIAIELKRLLPGFFKCVTLSALLPVIQRRALAFNLAKGVPFSDSEELAGKLVEKLWRNLFGGWPTGNAGAWVTTIRNSVLMDYFRAKERERNHFKKRNDATLVGLIDESFDEASFTEFVEELHATSPELIEQHLRADAKWAKTVASCEKKLADAADRVMSMEVEGQSVPLRKKRRRRPE